MRNMMKVVLVLALALLCCGCDSDLPVSSFGGGTAQTVPMETLPVETAPPATTPSDGNPKDVTCKGTYTTDALDRSTAVAKVGDHSLTNEQLQVWYWMEVTAWQQETRRDASPDWSQPLDTQVCPIDDSVGSWQQFFLKRALNTWSRVCALELHSREVPLEKEAAYNHNPVNHEKYLTGMPATKVLYGYNSLFTPNSVHDAYLNALPETLDQLARDKGYEGLEDMAAAMGVSADAVKEVVRLYNYSYTYYTNLTYYAEPSEEQILAAQAGMDAGETLVTVRQLMLVPKGFEGNPVTVAEDGTVTCSEDLWQLCLEDAEYIMKEWNKRYVKTENYFADMTRKLSEDPGSSLDGGQLLNVRPGQLVKELDDWCFDPARKAGEIATIRSPLGIHIVYFSGTTEESFLQAQETVKLQLIREKMAQVEEQYPAEITYKSIALAKGEPAFSLSDALYPDVGHERFPEVPLYLQQDYIGTRYNGYSIVTHGCGITTMAMLASYMADDELTPPEMCETYGRYGSKTGTDGMIFNNEPPAMGFYLREKNYDYNVAKEALQEGQIVVCLQHKGYWTRGGHYLVLESIDENDMVQVRDSNIYNYGRIPLHKEDHHAWKDIIANGSGYWIFEDKILTIPMCSRCGQEELKSPVMLDEYICKKCVPALLRRNTYLDLGE